jgi:alkylated DNA repair protein (DNA oxidative demethylase)
MTQADTLDLFESPAREPLCAGAVPVFLFGGARRADKVRRVPLEHGDVVVWGGPARLHYHGVLRLADGQHPQASRLRYNLTLRRAGW